nr:TOM1-like protein 6 [Ipomoea batatas]
MDLQTDMNVRDKILVLLDSWQEAFGGPGGKYAQYYWAYEELRRSGVQFPQRSRDTPPIFTPPATHAGPRLPQPGYGMPSNSSTRLDEAMAAEVENLSLSTVSSMRDVLDLLADMLQAVNPGDSAAVKDEVIVDLVDRCRSNQKKLMQMLATTGDENLLAQGLELNDSLQNVLAKHDAIASGTVLPNPVSPVNRPSTEMHKPDQKIAEGSSTPPDIKPAAPVTAIPNCLDEEEDEEDDFAQLARR